MEGLRFVCYFLALIHFSCAFISEDWHGKAIGLQQTEQECDPAVAAVTDSLQYCVDALEGVCDTCPPVYQPVPATCEEILALSPDSPSGSYLVRENTASASYVYCDFEGSRPSSCSEVKERDPTSPSGYYTIRNGDVTETVYCHIGELCGREGGWTRVAYLNMSDTAQNCPRELKQYDGTVRGCGRQDEDGDSCRCGSGGCDSVKFSTLADSFSEVCGKVLGYQWGITDGARNTKLDQAYVDGVSITHGDPRKHIFTLMAGRSEISSGASRFVCPCNSGSDQQPPSFVGDDYYCESGNPTSTYERILYPDDLLWDNQQCGGDELSCCSVNGVQPYFYKQLDTATADDIELRVCGNQCNKKEDTSFHYYEIYVK